MNDNRMRYPTKFGETTDGYTFAGDVLLGEWWPDADSYYHRNDPPGQKWEPHPNWFLRLIGVQVAVYEDPRSWAERQAREVRQTTAQGRAGTGGSAAR